MIRKDSQLAIYKEHGILWDNHAVIVGESGSGKTVLSKLISNQYRRKGFPVLVLDPVVNDGWGATYLTDTPEKLLDKVWSNFAEKTRELRAVIFIDECGDYTDTQWRQLNKLLQKGRNYGLKVYLIGQRCKNQIPPNSRGQCSEFIVFKQSPENIRQLKETVTCPNFGHAELLPKLHYIHKEDFDCVGVFKKLVFDNRLKDSVKVDVAEKPQNG